MAIGESKFGAGMKGVISPKVGVIGQNQVIIFIEGPAPHPTPSGHLLESHGPANRQFGVLDLVC